MAREPELGRDGAGRLLRKELRSMRVRRTLNLLYRTKGAGGVSRLLCYVRNMCLCAESSPRNRDLKDNRMGVSPPGGSVYACSCMIPD